MGLPLLLLFARYSIHVAGVGRAAKGRFREHITFVRYRGVKRTTFGQEPVRRQEKGRENQLESGSGGLFQRAGWGDGTAVPEADRSVSARLREEAEETDDEVSGGWLPLKSVGPLRRARGPCF